MLMQPLPRVPDAAAKECTLLPDVRGPHSDTRCEQEWGVAESKEREHKTRLLRMARHLRRLEAQLLQAADDALLRLMAPSAE